MKSKIIRNHQTKRTVKLGKCGVDSGQLVICDPSYLEGEFKHNSGRGDHAHEIYKCVGDNTFWQYTYGEKPIMPNVNKFPGSYADVIPKYGKSPNDLIMNREWIKTDIDPKSHIPNGEFSYRGICKATDGADHGGQLNFKRGHAGAAVAFSTGFGDGEYDVYAEIVDTALGQRVRKIWVEFF